MEKLYGQKVWVLLMWRTGCYVQQTVLCEWLVSASLSLWQPWQSYGRRASWIWMHLYRSMCQNSQRRSLKVTITTRLLVSHMSGIRHYEKDIQKIRNKLANKSLELGSPAGQKHVTDKTKPYTEQEREVKSKDNKEQNLKVSRKCNVQEPEEFYIKKKYDTVIDSLDLFKNDPLVFKPGTQFLYSTHAWTLLSAIVERASEQKFLDYMLNMFRTLGMKNTVPEEHEPIIYNRARYYSFNHKKRLVNSPYVDNSCKWAGGGFLSTINDLLLFGNVLLYSYQTQDAPHLLPGYLKPETISMMWSQVPNTEMSWDKDGKYAMGWGTVERKQEYGQCKYQRHYVSHTGGAVGASSVILILPEEEIPTKMKNQSVIPPKGIVVTIIANMQGTGLNSTALKIALEFEKEKSA
ncbi:serine beta-lactamase-like protein LACTB, mitochondrial isoform X2 [Bombina bombina]|uniref:serine beta-lactamase-like protein LACTB, mitochondrial isoform X2 n=1 Tax=Bombina bombina TaxID=8345 RepID=UPI00235AC1EF|nr:serine beta-lactamase-like protein LACTB, mitochondrial isoform X2 [Bombina bombina]XP_053573276.1 serine beta-lactamase-like protein LACTB, mitochondrial isoform X2 [Bombina bombina]XP_053573277.1 serine beta-lactamase-like protein LACTB, mitochondrial isoform X2 [Bombina bombina]